MVHPRALGPPKTPGFEGFRVAKKVHPAVRAFGPPKRHPAVRALGPPTRHPAVRASGKNYTRLVQHWLTSAKGSRRSECCYAEDETLAKCSENSHKLSERPLALGQYQTAPGLHPASGGPSGGPTGSHPLEALSVTPGKGASWRIFSC